MVRKFLQRKKPDEEIQYLISVLGSDDECTLGERYMSTLVYGKPILRYGRPYTASLRRLPVINKKCFTLEVFSETLDDFSVQECQGFVLLYDQTSEQSFTQMSSKLWDIATAKENQRRKTIHGADPTPLCIIGYNERGSTARTVRMAKVMELVRKTDAIFFELQDWEEDEVESIALRFAWHIHEAGGLPVRPKIKETRLYQAQLQLSSCVEAIKNVIGANRKR